MAEEAQIIMTSTEYQTVAVPFTFISFALLYSLVLPKLRCVPEFKQVLLLCYTRNISRKRGEKERRDQCSKLKFAEGEYRG